MKKLFVSILAAGLLCGCAAPQVSQTPPDPYAVEGLRPDFTFGMDASCVPALESSGVVYKDGDGQQREVFSLLKEKGISCIRVRIWNDPFDEKGNGYGGGNCDAENAIAIAKRCKAAGLAIFPDFHYSDFWADPGKQQAPKAWENLTLEEKAQALYDYTKETLQALKDTGVTVSMVQLGNETTSGLCGESALFAGGWKNICALLNSGAKAVREICPQAKIAIHFTNPEKENTYQNYAFQLHSYQVDYDVFASSYYPAWHGSVENLICVLNQVSEKYGKQTLIAETSYPYSGLDYDGWGNTLTQQGDLPYPFTVEGQQQYLYELTKAVSQELPSCLGIFYWEGTWVGVGSSKAENAPLWEEFGSGWASAYAAQYDPEDAGKWYGGCAVENQAFFDKEGKATPALDIFQRMRPS